MRQKMHKVGTRVSMGGKLGTVTGNGWHNPRWWSGHGSLHIVEFDGGYSLWVYGKDLKAE
jgi:uncharacterized protein (DUF39 family)